MLIKPFGAGWVVSSLPFPVTEGFVREMTYLEYLKVIGKTEFSFQNAATLAPLLNLAKPLEGRHAELA